MFRLQAADPAAYSSLLASLICTDGRDERDVFSANESLNPRGACEAYHANTHMQTHACGPHVCHADPACSASLLGSHEQRVSTERARRQQTQRPPQRQNAGGICCRGRDKQRSSSKLQGLAGACPGRSGWGLLWPAGVCTLVGGFLCI